MKRFLITVIFLIVCVICGFGLVSCQASTSPPTKPSGNEVCENCKKMALLIEMQKNKLSEMTDEDLQLNEQAVDYMHSGDYDKALEILKTLESKYTSNSSIAYNITCLYSLKGETKLAISYLHRTIQYGWVKWKYMDEDDDLNNIKNEAEYKKLREALETIYP
ncbi:MAG: hypothetical protein QME51_02950 [Planctomycetota bacterium]|nr:hypothetical protein [Planctomycetota bacterium]MDI6787311.1 hypothetical protein [Planctomycetota bacterium]